MSNCNKCGHEIKWTKRIGDDGQERNIPLNKNGKDHKTKIGNAWVCTDEQGNELKQKPIAAQTKQSDLRKVISVVEATNKVEEIHVNAIILATKHYPLLLEGIDKNGITSELQAAIIRHYEGMLVRLCA